METKLINIDKIPSEQELISLLGKKSYEYYRTICENIILLLSPDIELWDYAGRRGKYFHGYQINKKAITIYQYLSSTSIYKQVTCELHFTKRLFIKILKQRNSLNSKQIQEDIDFSIKFNSEFGGGYTVNVIIRDEETFKDVIKMIKIISSRPRPDEFEIRQQ